MFVGRARELEELERVLDAAQAGRGTTVLVAGEAGIGKTRLAAELVTRARGRGFAVLIGRSIDLVGTELPYQPFVEALGELPREAGSQLRVFETALALLADRTEPVLLVLEDLHWADTSTLDLTVFLAHNLAGRRMVLLGTYRDASDRFVEGVRRSEAAVTFELGPLAHEDVIALLADAPGASAIATRSGGNPFFAEELLAAGGELPGSLRDVLLQRVSGLDRGLLRLIAAAGRDVGPSLLRPADRESLRQAVDQGVLVADQSAGTFRFRHALLAEAVYATILPGEREELHGRLAEALARGGAAAAELAPHWAAAGRSEEAFATSMAAARDAEAVFGLSEALAHVERAIALWPEVPDAPDFAELCHRAAELAWHTGAAPRAAELAQQAIELVGDGDPPRTVRLLDGLGRYLHAAGQSDAGIAALERAVSLVPAEPPSPEFAQALATLGNGLISSWRFEESCRICAQARTAARAVGARYAEFLAVRGHGAALAYLGRGEDGLAELRDALELAESPMEQELAYGMLTDVLNTLGRPREAARVAATALEKLEPYAIDQTTLVANRIEALVASGEWDEAAAVSSAALRAMTGNYSRYTLIFRASLETGRGDFSAARAHLDAAVATVHEDAEAAICDGYACEIALWERRWADAERAAHDGLARVRSRETAQIRVWLCAKGLRAEAELAALARARHDAREDHGRALVAEARKAATEAASITPNAAGWLALAEAEYERAVGTAQPTLWADAATAWDTLERPPLAAYCRWHEAEALAAVGASRADASRSLRAAYATAARLQARPLLREIGRLAERARLDPEPLPAPSPKPTILDLTPRETEVLQLVARGLTNREIADELVISVKTASVHVSHILRKLDAPNRLEAAAIADRLEH